MCYHLYYHFAVNCDLWYLQILDLLGPKTEADLAPPPKVDKKGKGGDAGKKQKEEDSKGNFHTRYMRKFYFNI